MPPLRPMVICGPSGSGKSTLLNKLLAEYPDKFGFCTSHTTRNPRPAEEDGVHYHFTDKESMKKAIEDGKFIESATFSGNLYGTSKAAIQVVLNSGKVCVLDIDTQGVRQVKNSGLEPHYIFVKPPSIEALRKRLEDRKTETEESLNLRLSQAQSEMEYGETPGNFDIIIVNDDLDMAYDRLKQFVEIKVLMGDNLEVELIYLYPKENSTAHKTDKFELVHDEENPIPILRRGLKFTMAIRFAGRNFIAGEDNIRLIFTYGPNPNPIKGTKGIARLDESKSDIEDRGRWYAGLLGESGDSITLEVYAPHDIPVGIWNLNVETSHPNAISEPSLFPYDNDLYFLFNPWNCHDLTYMPDERLLDEYILTDVGKIWVGPWGSSRGREWVFGQFDGCVLPAAMLMFERSELPHFSRGDPIKVTRTISKLVNSNDDNGILVGRWDGDYEEGTAPSAWSGSVDILQEFLDSAEPVNYGQCWVFSGVVTTLCRALGIPSRVVSNLVSAHDANATLTVDKYYNECNEEMDFDPHNPMGEDSIWNYHVWNDVWMARPDLPPGYGGWQAIDATPQETSSGFYQCGPASLEAIRKGTVGYNYDVAFMVASVNADLMRWKEDPKSDMGFSKIYCNKYHIGRMILTKQPWIFDPNGDKDREDITDQYKAKEGTEAERLSLFNAVRGTELAKSFYSLPDPGLEDMVFDLEELERIKIGDSFSVVVNIKNNSDEVRNVKAVLSAGSVFYTGVKANMVKKAEGNFKMQPRSSEQLRLTVKPDDYLDKLVEYCIMKLYAIASVVETRQTWADEDDFQVLKPNINIRIPPEIPLGKPTPITLRFVNPLKIMLTKCRFSVSGPTLLRNQIKSYPDAKPGAVIKMDVVIIPKMEGEQKIVATFTSKELLDITGSAKVDVVDDE